MVTGHVGIAYLARRWRGDAPFVLLLVAALAPDILDVLFTIVGFDPPCGLYSHSLPAAAALTILALVLARAGRLTWGATAAITIALLLHFATDYVTGQKLLWATGPETSIVLYDHPLLDLALELPILIAGWRLVRHDLGVPRLARSRVALTALILVQVAFDGAKLTQPPTPPRACALPRAERLKRMFSND